MKNALSAIRRSEIVQILTLILLSGLSGLLLTAAYLIRMMASYGLLGSRNADSGQLEMLVENVGMYLYDTEGLGTFFRWLQQRMVEVLDNFQQYLPIGILILTVGGLLFFYLLIGSGYHRNVEKPCLRGLERIPFDLILPLFLAGLLIMLYWRPYENGSPGIPSFLLSIFLWNFWFSLWVLEFLVILLAKLRTGTLFSGTVIARVGGMCVFVVKRIPFIWKGALIWSTVWMAFYLLSRMIATEYRSFYAYEEAYSVFPLNWIWNLVFAGGYVLGLWIIAQMDLVRKKAKDLAEGNLHEKNAKRVPVLPTFHRCLADMDRISEGMDAAIEEKMKSERFQTELITNVSHDIKTPLTSIINYLDFLEQEEEKTDRDPDKVEEYMQVLERQSVRLKKLIEDLIETSKAASGSLTVEKEPCELVIFLQQIAGEYEEKLEKAQLVLNLSVPKEEIYVEADGRHLWRVLDNLLQNTCKYAAAHTRVYLQLQKEKDEAVITIKNISAEELNIPAEELMERFVRGDRSRHSEGSGLGLSIARSLTELQDGHFDLQIDGDLFKTSIRFPLIRYPYTDGGEDE